MGWQDAIPLEEQRIFKKSGLGQNIGFGTQPALLIIDVTYGFIGDKPEPILESIKRFPYSCGKAGWNALQPMMHLISTSRQAGIPIAYSKALWSESNHNIGILGNKSARHSEILTTGFNDQRIVEEITPKDKDIIIVKQFPSVFFATPFISILNFLRIDTLILCGCTTSGCVRATAVDAYSYNLRPIVVEECVFDRSQTSHEVSLFDMNMKYADVVALDTVIDYLMNLQPEII